MSIKTTYDDIDLLLKDLKSDIEDVLMDEVLDEVKKIEIRHIKALKERIEKLEQIIMENQKVVNSAKKYSEEHTKVQNLL